MAKQERARRRLWSDLDVKDGVVKNKFLAPADDAVAATRWTRAIKPVRSAARVFVQLRAAPFWSVCLGRRLNAVKAQRASPAGSYSMSWR